MPTEEVPFNHIATLVTACDPSVRVERAPRRLELPSGRVVPIPSERGLFDRRQTLDGFIRAEQGFDAALVIERTGGDGPPEILSDHRPRLEEAADATRSEISGCGGCSAPPWTGGFPLALLGIGVFAGLRRSRRQAPAAR